MSQFQIRVCDFFILCLCTGTSNEGTFLLRCLTQLKGQRVMVHACVQHDDIAALLQCI